MSGTLSLMERAAISSRAAERYALMAGRVALTLHFVDQQPVGGAPAIQAVLVASLRRCLGGYHRKLRAALKVHARLCDRILYGETDLPRDFGPGRRQCG
jgi:hypothetical protein